MNRSIKIALLALSLSVALGFGTVQAVEKPPNFPRKPIELDVVYNPGGGMDVTARTLAKAAEEILGHKFRVGNRIGGGGIVGHTYIAKTAKADGYTVGILSMGGLFSHIINKKVSFTKGDFDPIGFINFSPYVLMSTGQSFNSLIAKAKKGGPGSVRSTNVPGGLSELLLNLIEEEKGVKFARVPFQGGKPGVLGLLSGTVDMAIGFYTEASQYFKTGELRAIAVVDTRYSPNLPHTPPLKTLGVNVATSTFGATRFIALPVGVPTDVRAFLEASFIKVLNHPKTKAAYQKLGITVTPYTAAKTTEIYDNAFNIVKNLSEKAKGR